jgi:hypothetical protein
MPTTALHTPTAESVQKAKAKFLSLRKQAAVKKKQTKNENDPSTKRLGWIITLSQRVLVFYAALVLTPKSWGLGSAEYGGSKSVVLCPRELICSEGLTEVALIVVARLSAYYMLPAMMVIFLSKYKGLTTALPSFGEHRAGILASAD